MLTKEAMIERRWITIKEAAQYLGIHYVTAYRNAIKGLISAVKIGGISS